MPELTGYQEAALDYSRHLSLTANAGSGKTFVLSKRYVEIALKENIPLSRLIAITFTEKAAGELYRKIAGEIESRIESTSDNAEIKILQRIRRQLVSANISTIHSFCINVLRSFPVEAEVDAGFIPVDQTSADELIDQSIEKYFSDAIKNENKFNMIKYLIRVLGTKNNLSGQIKSLLGKRKKMQKVVEGIYQKDIDEIEEFYKKVFEETADQLLGKKLGRFIDLLKQLNDEILQDDPENAVAANSNSQLNMISTAAVSIKKIQYIAEAVKEPFTKLGTIRGPGYSKKLKSFDAETLVDELNELYEDLSRFLKTEMSPEAEKELARFGKIFTEVYSEVLQYYSEKKSHKSMLDFEDLLLYSEKLLGNPEIRKALSEKYQYIMIDEYQDTDEIQYNIFMPILDNLKKGNLFVVGDEKQSIYRFRDAEIEIFSKTKNEIGSVGENSILNLPHTFRLYPEIALFTNRVFSRLFADPDPMLNEVAYSELICAKNETGVGGVGFLICDEESEISESEAISGKITEIVNNDENINFGSFTVLCRKRKHFAELEKTFSSEKIPFQIVGGKGFYQRQPVFDILNMLDFLLDNKNDLSLIGVLRSPFFNLKDKELYSISRMEGNSLFEKLKNSAEENTELIEVVKSLNKFTDYSQKFELNFLLRKILEETGFWTIIAAMPGGNQEVANLKKLIQVAGNFTSQGLKSLYDFTDFLKTSIDEQEDESQAATFEDDNTVKIMTIHQSKGLEFENVFLYRCNDKMRVDPIKSKSLALSKQFGILTRMPVNEDYFNEYVSAPVVELENYINSGKELAEEKRLLYVAVTRAVKNLFICGTLKNEKTNKSSFLDFVITGCGSDLDLNEILIRGELKFLKEVDGTLKDIPVELELKMPVIREFPKTGSLQKDIRNFHRPEKLLMEQIVDYPKGDIVSATKVAVFSQCPLKYHLAYNLGLKKLDGYYPSAVESFNFSEKEGSGENYADLKGTLIHSILEKEIDPSKVKEEIKSHIQKFQPEIENRGINESSLIIEAETDLTNYFSSKTYTLLKSETEFKNEFEIYAAEDDNYLFGIIDKLIIKKEEIIIVDYKTDNISFDQIKERAEGYNNQLTFYAFLVRRLYPQIKRFSYRLVFIKHPDNIYEKTLSKNDLDMFKQKLDHTIQSIKYGEYPANRDHCKKCYFSPDRVNCIYLNKIK